MCDVALAKDRRVIRGIVEALNFFDPWEQKVSLLTTPVINPKEVRKISYTEFLDLLPELGSHLDDGVIFHINGHPGLQRFYEDELKDRFTEEKYELPDDTVSKQKIQKALFGDIVAKQPSWFIDSKLFYRATDKAAKPGGKGQVVGVHTDRDVNLGYNLYTFWIAFTHISRNEALVFLPAEYVAPFRCDGLSKTSKHLDKYGYLKTTDYLPASAVMTEMEPCEFLIFKSGRTAHLSPPNPKKIRVSCDIRLLDPSEENGLFSDVKTFYNGKDIGKFDGKKSVNQVLNTLWPTYNKEDALSDFSSLKDALFNDDLSMVESILQKDASPKLVINLLEDANLHASSELINMIINYHKYSQTTLLMLISHAKTEGDREILASCILQLHPINLITTIKSLVKHIPIRNLSTVLASEYGVPAKIVSRSLFLLRLFERAPTGSTLQRIGAFIAAGILYLYLSAVHKYKISCVDAAIRSSARDYKATV